jgi:aminopeptidase-like protein
MFAKRCPDFLLRSTHYDRAWGFSLKESAMKSLEATNIDQEIRDTWAENHGRSPPQLLAGLN